MIEGHHFLWEVWSMEHVSAETADDACIFVEAPCERPGAKPQDGLAVRHGSFAKACLPWWRLVISL